MTGPAMTKTAYTGDTQQFLTFALGQEQFGVEILNIQEIKGLSAITPLPNAPVCIKGVLNLRGTIVPIIDLRTTFGLPDVELTKCTVIVVVQVQGHPAGGGSVGQKRTMGFIVDAVSDVLNVAGDDVQPTPEFHGQVDTSCINGLAKAGEKLVILLDIEKVLTTADAATATQSTVEAASMN